MGVEAENRELARYSGALASSVVKLDITKMQMDIRQANAVAPEAGILNEQLGQLLVEVQPLRETLGRVMNLMAASAVFWSRIAVNSDNIKMLIKAFLPFANLVPGAIDKVVDAILKPDPAANKPGPLNLDLRALGRPGPANNMPGGKVAPINAPAFLPPLVKPGRQNPGGR
jgi:hypothetical protein